MMNEDSFQYALENTRVVLEPQQNIETFGSTHFRFLLVTELMDYADRVRVRDGRIEAERPRIVSPQYFQKVILQGFGERAKGFGEWLEQNAPHLKFLRYGFQFRKTDISQQLVHEPKQVVIDRLQKEVKESNDPLFALIEGVDDAWEVCLLKFTIDLIQRSAGDNLNEWRRRGFI